MSSRSFNAPEYKYGFNGQEKDNEVYGAGNLNTAEFWQYDTRLGRRWNLDPKPLPSISQYACFANSPIWMKDVKGDSAAVFYPDGTFWKVINDGKKEWTILHYASTTEVMKVVNGNQVKITSYSKPSTYQFADPVGDVKDIKNGVIKNLVFVSSKKIGQILGEQGALDDANRKNSYSYLLEEGKGNQKLDFSMSVIPFEFPGASSKAASNSSPMLFIPEGQNFAHNHFNFGNFLFGAAGSALGVSNFVLKMGGQYNSKFNSNTNGYPSQWDSNDDQLSIELGAKYSKQFKFDVRTYNPQTKQVSPLGKR